MQSLLEKPRNLPGRTALFSIYRRHFALNSKSPRADLKSIKNCSTFATMATHENKMELPRFQILLEQEMLDRQSLNPRYSAAAMARDLGLSPAFFSQLRS